MPGIYTHNYIFRRSVEGILKNKGRSYIDRSIETLFSTPEHFRAGLFGSIGPNIFDYMHLRRKGTSYGSEISFALHNGYCTSFLKRMTGIVMNNSDSRNEWTSVQRAYLLGYISHIISDSIIHPYIFYISGFPDSMNKGEIDHYRKMNLRFQYNIDNWFLYRDEWGEAIKSVDEMLPVYKNGRRKMIWPSLKYLILESLRLENEPLLREYFRDIKGKIDGDTGPVRNFDRIPYGISVSYKIKRSENPNLISMVDKLCNNPRTFSDFFVRYPARKRVDEDAMNIHQGRWQYPANQKGFRYESVLHLIKFSIDQVVRAWELTEKAVYGGDAAGLNDILLLNPYTGEKEVFFEDLKIKDPVRLKV